MNINLRGGRRSTLFAGFLLVVSAVGLRADTLWAWTYSSNLYEGNGTFIAESTLISIGGFSGYRIISMSGTWDGEAITSLMPILSYRSNDNLLLGPTYPQLSINGLAFSTPFSGLFNISKPDGQVAYKTYAATGSFDIEGVLTTFVLVPEPPTAALIVPTLLVFALVVRRRRVSEHAKGG